MTRKPRAARKATKRAPPISRQMAGAPGLLGESLRATIAAAVREFQAQWAGISLMAAPMNEAVRLAEELRRAGTDPEAFDVQVVRRILSGHGPVTLEWVIGLLAARDPEQLIKEAISARASRNASQLRKAKEATPTALRDSRETWQQDHQGSVRGWLKDKARRTGLTEQAIRDRMKKKKITK